MILSETIKDCNNVIVSNNALSNYKKNEQVIEEKEDRIKNKKVYTKKRIGYFNRIFFSSTRLKGLESSCIHKKDLHVKNTLIKSNKKKKLKKLKSMDENEKCNFFSNDVDVSLEVLDEIKKLEKKFSELKTDYCLIRKIGHGTFSTVYKAEVLNTNHVSTFEKDTSINGTMANIKKKKKQYVALKQIYVTSSPARIHNELKLLSLLSESQYVATLINVLRYQDEVIIVLSYYYHTDFRDFYRDLPILGIKVYLYELFKALDFIHSKGVIHRDLKPANYLYDPFKGKGVLVDFGLAESVSHSQSIFYSYKCPCTSKNQTSYIHNIIDCYNRKNAYPKNDQRPSKKANRVGTRGFRAPEVLFKCNRQTTKIDIWSAGVIGFSLLSRKFPLHNSPDDTDAILELILIFGLDELTYCANLHGCNLEINLSKVPEKKTLVSLLADFLFYEQENECFPLDSVVNDTLDAFDESRQKFVCPTFDKSFDSNEILNSDTYKEFKKKQKNYYDHTNLIDLLMNCFKMNPFERSSAKDILSHPFFKDLNDLTT